MFFHHGNFPKLPHHKPIGFPVFGMQLVCAFFAENEFEENRERRACFTCGDKECDKCDSCNKEEF